MIGLWDGKRCSLEIIVFPQQIFLFNKFGFKTMNTKIFCPLCSTTLIHQISNHREYWFCRHCWQEMPNLESERSQINKQACNVIELSTSFPIPHKKLVAS